MAAKVKATLIKITTNVWFVLYAPFNTFPYISLMWTEKSDFYPHFLNKKTGAKGSQTVAPSHWASGRELLTFIIVHIHISKKRSSRRKILVSRLQILGSFLSTYISTSQERNSCASIFKSNATTMKFEIRERNTCWIHTIKRKGHRGLLGYILGRWFFWIVHSLCWNLLIPWSKKKKNPGTCSFA